MRYDEFIGRVQNRARLPWKGDAEKATVAVLETLAERLAGGEPGDLASQLPSELGEVVRSAEGRQRKYTLDEFFQRVAEREGQNLPDAVFHARAVVEVLGQAVSAGEMRDIREQLPKEWDPLFGGAEGEMKAA
jgi:uncharacterized protein (DUF2267 family)